MTDAKRHVLNRTKALELFKRQPSSENLNTFKYLYAKARNEMMVLRPLLCTLFRLNWAYAKARLIIRENRRKSWRDYVSKLNHRTPTNKVWDMVREITCQKVFPSIKQITKYGNTITEIYELAYVLVKNIVKNSSTDNYS